MAPNRPRTGSPATSSSRRMIATNLQTPPKKAPKSLITIAQKQALIDNLQLEITERARKLRAQYADQAHALRARLEMRISRVPKALRDAKMGDLLESLSKEQSVKPLLASRGTKRTSDDMFSADEKENDVQLTNPKKRAKPTAPLKPSSQILSPKSSNLAGSKLPSARSASPLKPVAASRGVVTNLVAKAKSKRTVTTKKIAAVATAATGVGRTRRAAPAEVATAPPKSRKPPVTKKAAPPATKNESGEVRRTLRKRN